MRPWVHVRWIMMMGRGLRERERGFYEYRKVRRVHQTSAAHGWLELDMDSFKVVDKPGTASCVWIFRSTQLERRGSCYWHLVGRGQGCC